MADLETKTNCEPSEVPTAMAGAHWLFPGVGLLEPKRIG